MATKIVTKNSSTASAVPTASDLVQGELAVNVADKRLFTENNGGSIVELGTNPYNFTANHNGSAKLATTSTGIDVTGDVNTSGLLKVGTNDTEYANNYVRFKPTGAAYIDHSTVGQAINFRVSGSSSLDTNALTINSTGIDVTGTATMDGGSISGNLLIGTSSSSAKLTVGTFGDTARAAQFHGGSILIDGGAATDLIMGDGNVAYMSLQTTDNATAMKIRDHSGNADLVTVERASGNVGIGSASDGAILQLDKASSSYFDIQSDSTLRTRIYNDSSQTILETTTNNLIFKSASSEAMRIDSSGNLLVGTTSTIPFTFSSGTGAGITSTGTIMGAAAAEAGLFNRVGSDGSILTFFRSGSNVGSIGTVAGRLGIGTGDACLFFDDDNNKISPVTMVSGTPVDSNGLLDLGYSGARFKDLYLSGEVIAGAGENSNPSITSHVDTDTGLFFGGGNILGFSTGGAERMRIDSSGNLTVGDSSTAGSSNSACTISAGGAITTSRAATNNQTHHSFMNPNGVVGTIKTIAGQTSYNTSSDQRLKENIADADDAGSKVDAIQVRQYDWKADGSHQDYGMIAQELLEVAPEAVSQGETEEEMMGVDYSKLVPMLIKEIQSLRNRVAQLEE